MGPPKMEGKKVVSALFLDVKSAFPSVIKEKLVETMIKHHALPYLSAIIFNLFTNRSTSLKMEDYLSPSFQLHCGLPQGSPLSPILYIIYNSLLLINKLLDLTQDSISLGFIDDVTHWVPDINSLICHGQRAPQPLHPRQYKISPLPSFFCSPPPPRLLEIRNPHPDHQHIGREYS
jgi:hypothetical protein